MEKVINKCVEWHYDFRYEDDKIIIDNFTSEIANIDQLSIMYVIGQEKLKWTYNVDKDQIVVYKQLSCK